MTIRRSAFHPLFGTLLATGLLFLARPSHARPSENPFAPTYTEPPPLLLVGLHAGSFHDFGIGPMVGISPLPALRVEASYGYWTEHSFAGVAQLHIFPFAALTPYVTFGYELSVGPLPYGISLRTHRLVGGVGFEARVGGYAFVRAEMMGNGIIGQTLKDRKSSYDITPSDVFVARPGFVVGAYFL